MTSTTTRVVTAGGAGSTGAARGRRGRNNTSQSGFAWSLLTPALVMFALVFAVPILYAIWLSLQGRGEATGAFSKAEDVFVGLKNYLAILVDADFWASMGHLGIYAGIMVPLLMGTSIFFALLLELPRARARRFSRTAIFLPYGIPGVIGALMWGFLYVPQISPFYQAADGLGFVFPPLLEGNWVFVAIINIALWGGIGFNTVIIYTALRSLDRSQIDAARIDGAGEWRIAWAIKLPHVVPATVVTGLFSAIGALQVYSEPALLSSLTPAIDSTFFPLMRVYRDAFAHDDLNSAAAASILLALMTVVLSLLVYAGRALITRKGARR